jgi:hypothetical protein
MVHDDIADMHQLDGASAPYRKHAALSKTYTTRDRGNQRLQLYSSWKKIWEISANPVSIRWNYRIRWNVRAVAKVDSYYHLGHGYASLFPQYSDWIFGEEMNGCVCHCDAGGVKALHK